LKVTGSRTCPDFCGLPPSTANNVNSKLCSFSRSSSLSKTKSMILFPSVSSCTDKTKCSFCSTLYCL
uniref:Uncharacterized protein n=1 Tax=Cynoglossus semilaevis TaxID=244447 RepID=A0A3P8V5C3_CYNSE